MRDRASLLSARPRDSAAVGSPLTRACIAVAIALLAGTLLAATNRTALVPSPLGAPRSFWLASLLFDGDAPWLMAAAGALAVLALLPAARLPSGGAFELWRSLTHHPGRAVGILSLLATGIAAYGGLRILGGFALSRDEIMADFDAAILRSGAIVAAVPEAWRPYTRALNPDFVLPGLGDGAWASVYLPGNAVLRALVGLWLDPVWTGSLLAGIAILAGFGVARRLWPARPDAACLVALLIATSSQVLVTAMTSYAMTAHLALNLVWLLLVLRDDRPGHAGALAVGFLASGLHQLIFHPLFAAPFVLRFWFDGRRFVAFVYAAAYLCIAAFWSGYGGMVADAAGASPDVAASVGTARFVVQILQLLVDFTPEGFGLMLKNGLRFVVWQHLLLLPLALLGWGAIRRGEGIARPLAAGIVLTLGFMLLLLPYQGHGWGYRYLHGLIGSAALLAGYGWMRITEGGPAGKDAAASALMLATAASAFVLLPVHLGQATGWMAPYRQATDAIRRSSSDVVIVDRSGLLFAADLVRNDPFLRNRPKVLDLTQLDETQLAALCGRFTVSVFDARQARSLGMRDDPFILPEDEALRAERRAFMRRSGCGFDLIPAPFASWSMRR